MTAAMPAAARLSIGEVLAQLRPEFPDVTISKIRYLEAEGLLEPERAPSGYRKFSARDLERLRYILTTQRDTFWPLRVIRDNLEALDRGQDPRLRGTPPRLVLGHDGHPTAETFRDDPGDLRLSRTELLEGAGISAELLTEIEGYGMVVARGRDHHYDGNALAICSAVGELAGYGLEPRHLRAFKTAADREAGLVEQIVSPLQRQREPGAAARAQDAVAQLAALSVRLHTLLVRSALRRPG